MSLSISAVSQTAPNFDIVAVAKAPAKPTITQQLHTLATSGQSTKEIATTLGLSETEVEEALGTVSTAATALTAGLSIKV